MKKIQNTKFMIDIYVRKGHNLVYITSSPTYTVGEKTEAEILSGMDLPTEYVTEKVIV